MAGSQDFNAQTGLQEAAINAGRSRDRGEVGHVAAKSQSERSSCIPRDRDPANSI
jgi:hypothetical protein